MSETIPAHANPPELDSHFPSHIEAPTTTPDAPVQDNPDATNDQVFIERLVTSAVSKKQTSDLHVLATTGTRVCDGEQIYTQYFLTDDHVAVDLGLDADVTGIVQRTALLFGKALDRLVQVTKDRRLVELYKATKRITPPDERSEAVMDALWLLMDHGEQQEADISRTVDEFRGPSDDAPEGFTPVVPGQDIGMGVGFFAAP
jgi:hypothetical protein